MRTSNRWIRPLSQLAYFVVACLILYFYADPYFCSSSRTGQSRLPVSCKLALACSLWDFAAGWTAGTIFRHVGRTIPALFAGIIAAVGFASIPFWIYRGYGVFLFENTWADVSCFFTEASGMAFPFVVAPALAAATFIKEWVIGNATRESRSF
jgi:hypothetical protein